MARMSLAAAPTTEHCLACGHVARADGSTVACDACGLSLARGDDGVLTPVSTMRDGWRGEGDVSYPETGADAMASVEDTSFWFSHRNEVIALLLERFAPGRTLWDIGGGNGFQALRLQERGTEVVLVEPGLTGCRNAVARRVEHVIRGTIESVDLAPASLDAVSLFDVIEHLPDPVKMLTECRRVLRPSGRLFVTVPAYQALWSDEDEYAQHHRRYDKALLEEHLRSAGFEVDFVSYFFQPLVAPIFLVRSLPYRLRGRRRTEGATADLSEHGSGGLSQRVVEALLARELRALRAGRSLSFGSSLVAVAR